MYPAELLPQEIYKIILSELLPKKSYLQRKSLQPPQNPLPPKIRIDEVCREKKDLFGLSCNLHGKFKLENLKFVADKKDSLGYNEYWKEGDKVLADKDIKYTVTSDTYAVFLGEIITVHGQKFPYSKSIETKEKVKVDGKEKTKTTFVTTPFNGKILVVHRPTRCNFWHFEIIILDQDNNEILRNKAQEWAKSAADAHIDFLIKHFGKRDEPSDFDEVKPAIYCKD